MLTYWKNTDVSKNSSKFILDPVTVYLLPQAQQRGIDPEQLAKLAQYFTNAIKEELTKSGRYELVTQPGPGVMVLRIAITNVEPTGGKANAAVKGAAVTASTAVAPGADMLAPTLSVGKVSIEGEIDDSVSGERMVPAHIHHRLEGHFLVGISLEIHDQRPACYVANTGHDVVGTKSVSMSAFNTQPTPRAAWQALNHSQRNPTSSAILFSRRMACYC